MKLSAVWKEHPEVFGNYDCDRFPLLTKIIDARDDLSIQYIQMMIMRKYMKTVLLERQSAGISWMRRKGQHL